MSDSKSTFIALLMGAVSVPSDYAMAKPVETKLPMTQSDASHANATNPLDCDSTVCRRQAALPGLAVLGLVPSRPLSHRELISADSPYAAGEGRVSLSLGFDGSLLIRELGAPMPMPPTEGLPGVGLPQDAYWWAWVDPAGRERIPGGAWYVVSPTAQTVTWFVTPGYRGGTGRAQILAGHLTVELRKHFGVK